MIVRVSIDSDCEGILSYQDQQSSVYVPKHRSRLTEYEGEQLIKELRSNDPSLTTIYLYTIKYPDGKVSVIAIPNHPIGKLNCDTID